jgi:hypothetical protein
LAAPANNADDNWNASTFDYSVDPDPITGAYTTQVGKLMTVDGVYYVTDPATPLNPGDYSVFYFDDSDGTFGDGDTLTTATQASDQRAGGVPNKVGKFAIVVVQGKVDTTGFGDKVKTFKQFKERIGTAAWHYDSFEIEKAVKDFGTLTAYEYDAAVTDKGLSDTELVYNGGTVKVGIAMDGKALKAADIASIELLGQPAGVVKADVVYKNDADVAYIAVVDADGTPIKAAQAGTYTVRVEGAGDYAGKTAELSFTIGKLDLTASLLTIVPVTTGSNVNYASANRQVTGISLLADGTTVNPADYAAYLTAVNGDKTAVADMADSTKLDATDGAYTLAVQAPEKSANVTGGPVEVELDVTDAVVSYKYSGADFPTEFKPFANYSFDPSNITAHAGSTVVPYAYKVYKDGDEVASYDEPGKYLLELKTEFTESSDGTTNYAGHQVVEFTVLGQTTDWSSAVAYYSIDGKEITAAGVEYTGSAIVPAVSVLYKGEALAAGTDYAVSYRTDEGDAVESVVMPGDYEIVVTLNDSAETELTKDLKVNKAEIESAEATAEFFAVGAEPTFVGSTDPDFAKGQEFELAAADVDVEYYAAELVDIKGTANDPSDDVWVKKAGAKALEAADLEAGDYVADIKVKATCETLAGGVDAYDAAAAAAADHLNVYVQVLKAAEFTDVPADAWYAEYVYKANTEGYMNGVAQGIFAPEQPMQRSEFARVVFNMAGNTPNDGVEYPTQFTDVPANAWYAQAVEWAARYGIVTGTSATTFDPTGTITREQIATMLYRYAGNGAQADASVLDQFADADSISDWAKNAMAWAVEEGYMNGKGEGVLDPQGTALRCEIAKLAVMVQPEAL